MTFYTLFAEPLFSAQSTADVSATPELKASIRKEILGEQVEKLVSDEEYVIGHGDILSVSVYGEGDMAASSSAMAPRQTSEGDGLRSAQSGVAVRMDGRVSLQHIGDVEVVGMNLTQLADYLKSLFATVFEDPIVTTTLLQSNSLRYTVMGNITNPGIFYLDYPLTIVQTIARSGGFTEWANMKITLVRKNVKPFESSLFKGNTLEFDYDDFISGKRLENNVFIQTGDIIIVH